MPYVGGNYFGPYFGPVGAALSGTAALACVSTLTAAGSLSTGAGANLHAVSTLVGAGSYTTPTGRAQLHGTLVYQPGLLFEEALSQRLAGLTVIQSIAGGRVVPGMIPERSLLPCVTYAVPSKPRVPDLSGPAGIARARVQISCWAKNYGDAKRLALGVISPSGLPIGFVGNLGGGVTVTDTYHLNEMDTYEQPDNASDVGTYRVMFEMRMDYRE